jgi:hypothetical protein
MDSGEFDTRFSYHAPKGNQAKRYETIRSEARAFSLVVASLVPDCREFSLAMTKIEEAVFWANAAIARRDPEAGE